MILTTGQPTSMAVANVPIPDGRHLAKQPFADGKEVDNRSLIVPTKWQFAIRLLCRGADFGE
jgi:hypothetical protein